MKQRINITLSKSTHEKGVLMAKKESKEKGIFISFSKLVENLILKLKS